LCILTLTQFTQVSKTVNSRFVTIAPAKVERVTPDDAEVPDFNLLRNTVGLQHSFTRPFINALRARTVASQLSRSIRTTAIVTPDDADSEIVVLFDFSRLNRRTTSFHCRGLNIGLECSLHVGRGYVKMRCVPYRFAVTQDNHLRSFVTNPSPVRELVRDVTRRLHLEDVDAVYFFHFAI